MNRSRSILLPLTGPCLRLVLVLFAWRNLIVFRPFVAVCHRKAARSPMVGRLLEVEDCPYRENLRATLNILYVHMLFDLTESRQLYLHRILSSFHQARSSPPRALAA